MVEKGLDNLADTDHVMAEITEVLDNGLYIIHCQKGHTSKAVLTNIKFELLFDLGLNAIIDGYYRDAVSSITSSLERFYEFYIKAVWYQNGCSFSLIDENWKNISNQSERQLGAFIVSYVLMNKENAPLMNPNKEVLFRNNVIHKGYIPTREESINYAKVVLNLIEIPLLKLKKDFPDSVSSVYDYLSPKRLNRAAENEDIFYTNQLTYIDVLHGRELEPTDVRNWEIEKFMNKIAEDRLPTKLHFIKPKE